MKFANNSFGTWRELRKALIDRLKDLRYSQGGIAQYQTIFNEIERYLERNRLNNYSKRIGLDFYDYMKQHPMGKLSMKRIPLVLRRLNDLLDGKEYTYLKPSMETEAPDCFKTTTEGYLNNLKLRGNRESSIKNYMNYGRQFLNFLHTSGLRKVSDIQPKHIYGAFMQNSDKANYSNALRSFLRYLYDASLVAADMAPFVPSVRRPQRIPSVYSKEEIEKLLLCVDQTVSPGKRDYTIMLIALRLGLRTGDIARLMFDNIDFDKRIISIVQEKTEVPLRIALLPEVEDALTSYLQNERPASTELHIFLLDMAPYTPISRNGVYGAINRHFIKSGINASGRKRGGHALRMTLASELISEDVPYDAVRKILGQEDYNSTKRYIRFDVKALRRCALEVPPLSGATAGRLRYVEGSNQ